MSGKKKIEQKPETGLTTKKINELIGVDDSWKAPDRLMKTLFDREKREAMFREFLKVETDVSYDWFHTYFQDEAADRKKKKQDFTPPDVARLLTEITDNGNGMNYDCCAGTGGLTIAKWQHDRMKVSPFSYYPSDYFYTCEEISDRAIPFLLFNVMIRGMNANIVHCDILTRKTKGVFFIQNDDDNFLGFSSLNVMPYTELVEREMNVQWTDFRYPSHIESKNPPPIVQHAMTKMRSAQSDENNE